MNKKSHPFILRVLPLLSVVAMLMGLTQCKPKPAPEASTSSAAEPASPSAPAKAPSLVDHAAKLGVAAQLPQDTELFVSSVNLKAHLTALKTTAFYKEISALMADKTPAPTAGDKTWENVQKLWGDDFFIAGAAGFAQSAALLKDFNQLYNEVYFKAIMTGGAASMMGAPNANNPMIYLQAFLNDPATLERASKLVTAFELPPLLVGVKVEKADEVLKELMAPALIQAEADKKVTISEIKTAEGDTFTVATLDMMNVLPESGQQEALAKLPPEVTDESRKILAKAYDDLQAKKFLFAWGTAKGHIIFACGRTLDHIKFAANPATSILSQPEMAFLLPHVEKNLTSLAFMSGAALNSLNDPQPIVPMLKGAVSAMKENPVFKELGAKLDAQVAELSPLEAEVFTQEATNLVGVNWWDKGLHSEAVGGIKPKFMDSTKPLSYSSLVNKSGVIFGVNYQGNRAYGKSVEAWMEKLFSIAYSAAQELVKAGIAGPEGGQQFAMFEGLLAPTLQKIYAADKEMSHKGLGTEAAFIIDINGKMPALPGLPPETKGMMFPRITTVHEVTDRKALGDGWVTISKSINDAAAAFSGMAPAAPDAPPAGALFSIPDPITSEKNGVTSYFFGLPFFSGDLLPCSAINDKVLILSTSKEAAESFALDISTPVATPVDGLLWKFDLSALTDFMSSAASIAPNQTPDQVKQMKETLKWMKPFKAMQGRAYLDGTQWRSTFKWEITDLVSFD
jgi:hypothetical protein